MLSLRDALDEKITAQLIKDMGIETTTAGAYLINRTGRDFGINVDELVNVVLTVIRDNAA